MNIERCEGPDTLEEALEDAGYECRSYSGRGMFGKECLGVDTDGTLGISTHLDLLRAANRDAMGLGVIFYWPEIPYTESDNEDQNASQE